MAHRIFHYTLFVLTGLSLMFSACKNSDKTGFSESEYKESIAYERLNKDKTLLSKGVIEEDKLETFKGLQYFDINSSYRIKAGIHALDKSKVVFKTTTDRAPEYYRVFELRFRIDNKDCRLTAYCEKENPEGADLFIPFRDASSGPESYGGGRYIDVSYAGEKDSLILDFNKAYNPYCHYNHKYSCPLVPDENKLTAAIRAGEKKLYD